MGRLVCFFPCHDNLRPPTKGCSTMPPSGMERFLSTLKSYFNTDTFVDAVVVCGDHEFKVHRIVLSAHSNYFATELNGKWKESDERKVTISDFDPSVVEAMLRFMYSFDYNNAYGTSTMVFDAQVYQIADKYGMEDLKTHSQEKFHNAITTGWSMDDFPLAISIVYESTPEQDRGLRDLAVEVSLQNIDKLLDRDDFRGLLRTTADFAADLIPFLANNPSKQYRCPSCQTIIKSDYSKGCYHCPSCGHDRSDWKRYSIT